jgi:hypothetical protein
MIEAAMPPGLMDIGGLWITKCGEGILKERKEFDSEMKIVF